MTDPEPPRCPRCGSPSHDHPLCPPCFAALYAQTLAAGAGQLHIVPPPTHRNTIANAFVKMLQERERTDP